MAIKTTDALIKAGQQTALKADPVNKYDRMVTSFSGADMVVMFLFPNAAPVVVGTASTVGYSLYRQLAPVRTLGRISAKGHARGGVTFAGTIIFTVINQAITQSLRQHVDYLGDFATLRPDELPPFDIIITFANELGQTATLSIYGVSITDETTTFSVEDIFTENVMTFIARDIRHMSANDFKNGDYYKSQSSKRQSNEDVGKFTLADLYATKEMEEYNARLEQLRSQYNDRYKVTAEPPRPEDTLPDNSTGPTPRPPQYNGTIKITVTESYMHTFSGGDTGRAERKATNFTVYQKVDGKTTSKKIENNGGVYRLENAAVGKTYEFWAEKTGYKASEKKTAQLTENGQYLELELQMVEQDKPGKPPAPSNEAVSSKKLGDYTEEKIYSLNKKPNPGSIAIQVFDKNGNPLKGIKVLWKFYVKGNTYTGGDRIQHTLGFEGPESGEFNTDYTDDNGISECDCNLNFGKYSSKHTVAVYARVYRFVGNESTFAVLGVEKEWLFKNN